jgi:hypothetical protein
VYPSPPVCPVRLRDGEPRQQENRMPNAEFTISYEAQFKFPRYYHVMCEVHDEKDMSGNVHAKCVKLEWPERHEIRRAIFDAVTGEYITE